MTTADRSLSDGGSRALRWAWPALAVVLIAGLGLRLWGVRQGLPYAYNTDEADHFVPHAVKMFADGTLNPKYFANPPAFTYVLHLLFALWYGGGAGVRRAFALHPEDVYTLARVAVALLGTGALWLLYATGARLCGRAVGVLAAAIEAVAFLPVFYAHLALNDAPTLAPLTLSLLGTAGVASKGRMRDYLLAGVGLGLACATKYTAGIVLLPLLVAAGARYLDADDPAKRRVLTGLPAAGAIALAAFLVANPYAVLDYHAFHAELVHQSTLSAESQGKLGAPKQGGLLYYLWSLTWGLGWAPALAALGGSLVVWRSNRRLGALLVPATLLFLLFMGLQGRYFGRWLLPIFPLVCLLAAFFVVRLIAWITSLRHLPAAGRAALAAVLVAALLAQGLLYSVHSGLVLSRSDTRTQTRDWMVANIPAGSKIVVEPVAPNEWANEAKPGTSTASNPARWRKYASLRPRVSAVGVLEAEARPKVGIENYETTLAPALVGYYEANDYCWVVSGSTQSGRAFVDPRAVPQAVAYYEELARQGEVVYRASPYARGHGPASFGFDWSFDYYPLAYERPGPQMTVYRLHGGRCATH
ncbi:MAG TPA: glycosyltransferase family 39 protein [Solirubrobacteraceae bacterium]|nr:glycosyltransferase family 39 protein [Solirubrobacteraceae bacterium]